MIIDSFDDKSKPIMNPGDFYGEKKYYSDICILTFSNDILEKAVKEYNAKVIGFIGSVNGKKNIYLFNYQGRDIVLYLVGVSAPVAHADIIELNWLTGATKFVMFGSCGNLNKEITKNKFIVPSEAYRDEGVSYHFLKPSDYIKIKNADIVSNIFDELKVPYIKGRVWTTDCFYMETVNKIKDRVNDGCLAVDMELSGVEAACDYYGFDLYDFLATGDTLSLDEYDRSGLNDANNNYDKFLLALEIIKRI